MTHRQRIVALTVACALFLQTLDGTVLGIALPAIARDFGVPAVRLHLAITCYLMALAIFMPVSGWLADRFGARWVFCCAILIFATASIACAFAQSMEALIVARTIQGIGGAMTLPVARLALLRAVPKKDFVRAMAWVAIPGLVGPLLGPPVGGFLVEYADWTWIFWLNVPICVIGFVLAFLFFDDTREEAPRPFDIAGFVLIGFASLSVVFGFETIVSGFFPQWLNFALILSGFAAGWLYVRRARHVDHPVLDTKLMRVPTFRASVVGGTLFRFGIGATPFLVPLMLQEGFGQSALAAGFVTFAAALGAILMKVLVERVLGRFGFRQVLIWNAILSAVSIGSIAFFSASTPYLIMFAVMFAGGFFRSLQFTAINSLSFADLSHGQMSNATSFTSTMQQLSLSIGVGIAAFSIEVFTVFGLEARLGLSAYAFSALLMGVLMLCATPFFAQLSGEAGEEMSGHKKEAGSSSAN